MANNASKKRRAAAWKERQTALGKKTAAERTFVRNAYRLLRLRSRGKPRAAA